MMATTMAVSIPAGTAVIAAAPNSAFAASTTASTMIDGFSNGVATKYNSSCLEIAYENAKNELLGEVEGEGEEDEANEHAGFKCYRDGKPVKCSSVREDGQTDRRRRRRTI